MNALQALQAFWSDFDIPAFDENVVPTKEERIEYYGAAFPYITYEASSDFFGVEVAQTANIYYRSTSWAAITEKEQEIASRISRGGLFIACDNGALWIKRATPWAQRMGDQTDDMIRRIVLNYTVEFIL